MAFISPVGIEFLTCFILQHQTGFGARDQSSSVSAKIHTTIKKLLHFQKSRDAVISTNPQREQVVSNDQTPDKQPSTDPPSKVKSIFYSFVLKCVMTIVHQDQAISQKEEIDKYLSYMKMTKADIYQWIKTDLKTSEMSDTLLLDVLK